MASRSSPSSTSGDSSDGRAAGNVYRLLGAYQPDGRGFESSSPLFVTALTIVQPDLFDAPPPPPWSTEDVHAPLARVSDPPASHAAAIRAFPDAKAQEKWIMGALLGVGARGATARELATLLQDGWDNVIVSRRIAGLRDAGYLVTFDGRTDKGWGHLAPALERAGCHVHVGTTAKYGLPVGQPPELDRPRASA